MIRQKTYLYRIISVLLFALGAMSIALAQPQFIKSTLISAEEGIEGLGAYKLFLDAEQRVWIKTDMAINVYDGNEAIVLKKGNGRNNLHSSNGIDFFVDHKDYVDIYYQKTVSFFDRWYKSTHEVDSMTISLPSPQDTIVKAILSYSKKTWLLCQNKETYYFYNPATEALVHSPYLERNNHFVILKSIAGKMGFWIMDKAFNIYFLPYDQLLTQTKYRAPEDLTPYKKTIRQSGHILQEDSLGGLWISYPTMNGVFYKNTASQSINKVKELPDDGLYVFMWQDQKGRAVFSLSRDHMFVHDYYLRDKDGEIKHWEELMELTNIPTDIYSKDFYDYLFLGTYRDLQVIEFTRPFIDVYHSEPMKYTTGKYGNIIWGGIPVKGGSIYIVGECSWYQLLDGELIPINIEDDIVCNYKFIKYAPETNTIYSLRRRHITEKNEGPEYDRRRLLSIDAATRATTYIDVGKEIFSYTFAPNRQLYLIYKNPDESFHLGLYQIDTKKLKHLRQLNPIKKEIVQFTYDQRLDCIWILFKKEGLYQIDLKKSIGMEAIDLNLDKQAVQYVNVNLGAENDLWISTSEGAILLEPSTKKIKRHITKKDGLKNKFICGVIPQDGFSWISTFYGLYAYDMNNDNVISIFETDGLPSNEFNRRAANRGIDGYLYFGSGNGLVSVDPSVFEEYGKDFRIYLRQIFFKDDNKKVVLNELPNKPLVISHSSNQQVLKITLGSSFWGDYLNTNYLYLMDGIDKGWKKINGNRSVKYDRLPVGRYTLHIKGISPIGIHSQNELVIKIVVTAPFYKKTAFIVTVISGIIGLLIFLFTRGYYGSRKRREGEKLQYEKRISQLELMALQSQMNPHFIFNAINAIQEYLWSNDKEFVEKYLNDFAKLTRLYLESSKVKVITLEQEIELLRLYSALEKLRFQERIEVNIEVSENIEPRYFKIPSMMVQPFVENAINHGLFHKEGKGTVNIVIFEKNEKVHIIVHDDGIGRAAAKKIKKESLNNYKSRALQITEERIEVLKKYENIAIDINIEDLFDENKKGIGTRVEIIIPEMF